MENELTEYSCSECGNEVGKDDVICPHCKADFCEEEDQVPVIIQDELPRFIRIIAVVFIVFHSLKSFANISILVWGVMVLLKVQLDPDAGLLFPGYSPVLPLSIFLIVLIIDWIPSAAALISSAGLFSRKKWSIKMFIKSLYAAIIVNFLLIAGLFFWYSGISGHTGLDLVFDRLASFGFACLFIESVILFMIKEKFSKEKYLNLFNK